MAANLKPATPDAIAEAGVIIRRGGLVAFPTETVYGLAADATNGAAVARIFAAKDRPRFNPLIVHVGDPTAAELLAKFNDIGRRLAARFWPGPLSLVLPRRDASPVSLLVSAGLDTLAIRVPRHSVGRALIAEAERPLAAPSANRSGEVSPTTAAHVVESLGDAVDLILDGGACPVGIESTVLDLCTAPPAILRPGAVTEEEIIGVIGDLGLGAPSKGGLRSPGMLESHYAPRLPLRLEAAAARPGEALLAFGPEPVGGFAAVRNLSEQGDLAEAAANLFAMLRDLDRPAYSAIAVTPLPDVGLGRAINDRLRRAAAPRRVAGGAGPVG
jgi:L-threonylcarbamoyladenylate synthase